MEVRRRCHHRILFCKIQVRPRSCLSYPLWHPCVVYKIILDLFGFEVQKLDTILDNKAILKTEYVKIKNYFPNPLFFSDFFLVNIEGILNVEKRNQNLPEFKFLSNLKKTTFVMFYLPMNLS